MVIPRRCKGGRSDGDPCRMAPLLDSQWCWAHAPANADAAVEARRLGGLRRRREGTLSGAYEYQGLTSVAQIRRLLDIAVLDTLGLDNSLARARTLIAAAQATAKLLETGELEARLQTLEGAVLGRRLTDAASPFEADGTRLTDFGAPTERPA